MTGTWIFFLVCNVVSFLLGMVQSVLVINQMHREGQHGHTKCKKCAETAVINPEPPNPTGYT